MKLKLGKKLKRILLISLPIAIVIGLVTGLFLQFNVPVKPNKSLVSISLGKSALANPAFTARTETYARGSSLTTPFDFTVNKATGVVDGDIMFMFLAIYSQDIHQTNQFGIAALSGMAILGGFILLFMMEADS